MNLSRRTNTQLHLSLLGLRGLEESVTYLTLKTTLLLIEPDRTAAPSQLGRGLTYTLLRPDLDPLTVLSVTVE